MKNRIILLLVFVGSFIVLSCNSNKEKSGQATTDLITIRTLGLAYLEEFKHEEAEKEFLKLIRLAPEEKLGYANLGLTYLRTGRYDEAEKQLLKAISIDTKDPDIRLILATVYQMKDERGRSISQLKEALTSSPQHVKVLYALSEMYSSVPGEDSLRQKELYTQKLAEAAPANLVPRLNLIDIYIRKGESDKAVEQMELVKRQFPEFPKEAEEFYGKTITLLRKNDKENAIISFTIFHNYLKVSSPYQAGMVDLKGPGGNLIGFPLITFSRISASGNPDETQTATVIRFTDATLQSGLNVIKESAGNPNDESTGFAHVAAADFDGDGDMDLYAGSFDPSSSSYRHYLLSNDLGMFTDISAEAGLNHTGKESSASFADYDNDGFFDIFVTREGGDILYRNAAKGKYENVTAKAGIGSKTGGTMAIFLDADQDGDLDLFEAQAGSNLLFRNNADGSFTEQSGKMGFAATVIKTRDAAFGDFDEDGDLDLMVVNEKSGNILYSNQRQGIFRDATEPAGLKSTGGSGAVAVGDYNNDGFLDMFIASLTGKDYGLFRNLNNGRFEKETGTDAAFGALSGLRATDATFLDYDNDGHLDLLIAGEPASEEGRGLFLYRNDGPGKFSDASGILPPEIRSGRKVLIFDYNDDGDQDIIVAGLNGGIRLLRNDGGNSNHFIKMKLVGLRTGSAKNNFFGIGAKVELRAGDLYQTMVVTNPDIHFGIGTRSNTDVIRITWTNGVPQNMFQPGSDQSIVESQVLKGSCPFLYTWNGEEYVFVKDILWRSALGMPLGIMGGTTAYAFPDASDDYLKIAGEQLKPQNGKYQIQVTSELWETIYLDRLRLVVVDHPENVEVYVPEQFSPPPFPGNKIYTVNKKHLPVSAEDGNGNDVLSSLSKKDDNYVTGFNPDKYQGITGMHDLIIDPGNIDLSGNIYLFMNGWIFPADASINVALSQSAAIKTTPPVVQVIDKNGEWKTVTDNLGFPMGKDKTVIADLTGKITSADRRVRIRTNLEIYWDEVFFSDSKEDNRVSSIIMDPVSADLHYRGFSGSFRKGGRYGPHWFDYSGVSTGNKWRDLTGNYTRYGDVLPLLKAADNKYIITNAGDETTVTFDAEKLPALPAGWKRDFLIHSVGWVKDGDLNTATGNTVLPLPFHGMKIYPPSPDDKYPDDPELQKYNREYNTRVVTQDGYLNALKSK